MDEKMNNPCDDSSLPSSFFGLVILYTRTRSNSCTNTHVYTSSELLRDFATREFNAFLWLSLLVITALSFRKLFHLFSFWYKAKQIPGPSCSSFYGHCELISRENFTDVLSECHEKYGPIVKLWLGPSQLLVSVKDPMLIKKMLIKAEDKPSFSGKAFHLAFGKSSLFAPAYEKVRKRRELLAAELNERSLESAKVIPMKVADHILDKIESIRARGSIDCRFVSQHMAFTIMGTTFFGEGFLAWPKATIYEELLMLIAKDACFWASYNVTPFWRRGFWRYQSLCTKLKCLTQDMLQNCRKSCKLFGHLDQNVLCGSSNNTSVKLEHGAQCCADEDFQDCYSFHDLNDHQNDKEERYGNIMRVMFHGCNTTAALISNVLTWLVMHKEIQDKVYSEISNVGRCPSKYDHDDVSRMPLLLATVYEASRLLSTNPMLQRCSLKHDLSFGAGVTVPAGAILVVPVQLLQKDDSSWGSDASNFDPYRFLSNGTKGSGSAEEIPTTRFNSLVLNDPNENATFLPFGSGTRACVGQKFVIQVVATLLASLLKNYEIRLNSRSDDDSKPILIQHHPNSLIQFVRREQ